MKKELKPGIIPDFWKSPAPPQPQIQPQPTQIDVEKTQTQHTNIQLDNYGGISSDAAADKSEMVAQILDFCVRNLPETEGILTELGIVVTQLKGSELTAKFYIRRPDGWILAIPQARTREEGLLQLIQAFLKFTQDGPLNKKLQAVKLQPYKF